MTPEVMFRAIDKITGELVYFYQLDIAEDNTGLICQGDAGAIDLNTLEQCTTLRDKNNNDIYKGDICKSYENYVYEVVFVNGAFGYNTDQGFISFAQNHHFKWVDGKCDKIEIIGNIHEGC
jgi:YopX protein